MKDKFLAKFDEILSTYATADRNYRAINQRPYKKQEDRAGLSDSVIEKNVGTLSKRIEDPNLELSNAKEHDQIKV